MDGAQSFSLYAQNICFWSNQDFKAVLAGVNLSRNGSCRRATSCQLLLVNWILYLIAVDLFKIDQIIIIII